MGKACQYYKMYVFLNHSEFVNTYKLQIPQLMAEQRISRS
jgi:hypothetical protein